MDDGDHPSQTGQPACGFCPHTIEVVSGFARRQREGTISPTHLIRLQNQFLRHIDKHYRTIPMDEPIVRFARQLVVRHPLRTLDAIQLASALTAQTALGVRLTFVSADTRLLTVAAAEGLATDNPNLHP